MLFGPSIAFGLIYCTTFYCKECCCKNKNQHPGLFWTAFVLYVLTQLSYIAAVGAGIQECIHIGLFFESAMWISFIVTWAVFCCGEKKSLEEKDADEFYTQRKVPYGGYGNATGMAPSYPGYGQQPQMPYGAQPQVQMPQPQMQYGAVGAVPVRAPAPTTV